MNASLKNQIAPPVARDARNFSNSDQVKKDNPLEVIRKNDVNFKSLLLNSNKEERQRQEARKSGDLSSADSYENFLEDLARQTDQARAPKNNLDKDDFLKLFVTQLQHQDPLNPKDGAEMAAQLAQFHGLEQMMNVNKGLERLEGVQQANNSANLVNYIGKEVGVMGGDVHFDAGKHSTVEATLPSAVTESRLEIKDESGTVVLTKTYGPLTQGKNLIAWDGKLPEGQTAPKGKYTMNLTAIQGDGSEQPIELKSTVKISGVDMSTDTASLETEIGPIGFSEISNVSVPINRDTLARQDVVEGIQKKIASAKQAADQAKKQPTPPTPQ